MTIVKYQEFTIDTEKITIDDMPNQTFREIFAICGADVAISLLTKMQGNYIAVPARGMINFIKSKILENFDGSTASIRRIARTYGTTENFVRNVLSEARVTNLPSINQREIPGIYNDEGGLL